jgi:hypothetical protein
MEDVARGLGMPCCGGVFVVSRVGASKEGLLA